MGISMKPVITLPALALVMATACPSLASDAQDEIRVVREFVAAFNAHDADAMLALAAEDIRWMSVSETEITVQAESANALGEAMAGYFSNTPGARAEIRSITASGPFVNTVEEAFWGVDGEENSQCAIAVYELAGEEIKSVWYFSGHTCELDQ